MTAQLDAPVLDSGKLEEFACKVAGDQAAAYNAILVYLGDRLGIWRSLATLGTTTVAQLAEHAGVAPRYLQEWLAAQAANGYVTGQTLLVDGGITTGALRALPKRK